MSQSVLVCLNCGRSYDFRQLDAAIRLPLRDGKSEVFSQLMDHVLAGLGLGLVCKDCTYPYRGQPNKWMWCSEVKEYNLSALRKVHDTLARERDRAREIPHTPPGSSELHRLPGGLPQ